LLGDTVAFVQGRARNVIPEGERTKVFAAPRDELLETAQFFAARRSVPAKLLRRRRREALRERAIRRGTAEEILA
jgi:hypothetical protein